MAGIDPLPPCRSQFWMVQPKAEIRPVGVDSGLLHLQYDHEDPYQFRAFRFDFSRFLRLEIVYSPHRSLARLLLPCRCRRSLGSGATSHRLLERKIRPNDFRRRRTVVVHSHVSGFGQPCPNCCRCCSISVFLFPLAGDLVAKEIRLGIEVSWPTKRKGMDHLLRFVPTDIFPMLLSRSFLRQHDSCNGCCCCCRLCEERNIPRHDWEFARWSFAPPKQILDFPWRSTPFAWLQMDTIGASHRIPPIDVCLQQFVRVTLAGDY
mmetsp:Transcript_1834/g.4062  ORF Transcript_1834/g.4062 Transcript_1834/m.4062 type:complete len:263 (-) Transcript_1834:52-840(-)